MPGTLSPAINSESTSTKESKAALAALAALAASLLKRGIAPHNLETTAYSVDVHVDQSNYEKLLIDQAAMREIGDFARSHSLTQKCFFVHPPALVQ